MTIGIIGFGQVAKVLLRIDYIKSNLSYLVIKDNRNEIRNDFNNTQILNSINEVTNFADINLILVNDKNIENVVSELIENLNLFQSDKNIITNLNKKIFIHFSGNLDLSVLNPIINFGFNIIKLHPFQTFAKSENIDLRQTAWLCEMLNYEDLLLKTQVTDFVNNLNGKVFFKNHITNFDDKFYHLAAVFASNYLNSFIQLSKDIANLSGIPVQDFLVPIINQTIKNNFCDKIESKIDNNNKNLSNDNFPISGPIIRKDTQTIIKHLEALKSLQQLSIEDNIDKVNYSENNKFLEFYKLMGKITIEYALKNGKFENNNIDDLKKLFE